MNHLLKILTVLKLFDITLIYSWTVCSVSVTCRERIFQTYYELHKNCKHTEKFDASIQQGKFEFQKSVNLRATQTNPTQHHSNITFFCAYSIMYTRLGPPSTGSFKNSF